MAYQVIVYVLEKSEDLTHGWEEVNWFTKSNLDSAESEFKILSEHGFGNYRVRKITIDSDGEWDWIIHLKNFKTNEED